MAHYAYKNVCYDIDYEKWKSLVKQFEEENECEHDGDGNYDGDNWYVAEMWIRELIAERDALKKDAERYRWLRPNLLAADFDWNESGESAIVFKWPRSVPVGADCDKNIDAAIDAEIGAQL